jgi:hypothetical protein
MSLSDEEQTAMLRASQRAHRRWRAQASEDQQRCADQRSGRFDLLGTLEMCAVDVSHLRNWRLFDASR